MNILSKRKEIYSPNPKENNFSSSDLHCPTLDWKFDTSDFYRPRVRSGSHN
jgi:hypothetical protein